MYAKFELSSLLCRFLESFFHNLWRNPRAFLTVSKHPNLSLGCSTLADYLCYTLYTPLSLE